MAEWIARLRAAAAAKTAGAPVAMISILATEGSAPRGPGTRMLVGRDGQHGTIGGGRLELLATEQARAVLDLPAGSWRVQDYPLGPLLGQCCGGQVRLLVEHVDRARLGWLDGAIDGRMLVSRLCDGAIVRTVEDRASGARPAARGPKPAAGTVFVERLGERRRPVYLFGAGHVGRAVAAALAPLPFTLAWFDPRADHAVAAGAVAVAVADLAACVDQTPADAAILILTHDHALDYVLTVAALGSRAGFVGLIGSATKRARFVARLARDGIDPARLICPIGLPGIDGKEPEVIAAATAAQLLALRAAPDKDETP